MPAISNRVGEKLVSEVSSKEIGNLYLNAKYSPIFVKNLSKDAIENLKMFAVDIIKQSPKIGLSRAYYWLGRLGLPENSDWVASIQPSHIKAIKNHRLRSKLVEQYSEVIIPMLVAKYGLQTEIENAGLYNCRWTEDHDEVVDKRRASDPKFH